MCERKRRHENEEWMKVAKEVRTQKQVWKVINRQRRRKVEVNKEIRMEEWDKYFRRLLGGLEREGGEGGGEGRGGRIGVRGSGEGDQEIEKREGGGGGWDTE